MSYALLRYVGAKHRLAKQIAVHLKATRKTCLCEVFGGSAAVMLNAGFKKRVYNDLDGDLVNFFRVLADAVLRQQLINKLQYYPASRQIFEEDYNLYVNSGLTFASITDKVERASATFYRHAFAFGGKIRSGGFQVSVSGRPSIQELSAYKNKINRLEHFGEFFFNTVIEHLPYDKFFKLYSNSIDSVIYVDPPYTDIQNYYSIPFTNFDHVTLSYLCLKSKAPVVISAYDNDTIKNLYPTHIWQYHYLNATKNSSHLRGKHSKKETPPEIIITKIKVT